MWIPLVNCCSNQNHFRISFEHLDAFLSHSSVLFCETDWQIGTKSAWFLSVFASEQNEKMQKHVQCIAKSLPVLWDLNFHPHRTKKSHLFQCYLYILSSISCYEPICFLISFLACSVTEKYPGCFPLRPIAIIFPRYQ